MTLDPKFQYLGRFPFDIKGIAGGYRYVWGETEIGKHLRRTFIVQAEGYYLGNQGSYKYGTPNPATLGVTCINTMFGSMTMIRALRRILGMSQT